MFHPVSFWRRIASFCICFIFTCVYSFGQSAKQKLPASPFGTADDAKIEIIRLGDGLNSEFSDFAPVITADGEQLFFTSRRPTTEKDIKKSKEGNEKIFLSLFDTVHQTWLPANLLTGDVNSDEKHTSAIGISADGQKILIYRGDGNGDGNGEIYESKLVGSNWSEPESLGNPINSPHHETSATYSPDGNTIYFVSERPGGAGGRDIWKCTRDAKGKWGRAENCGRNINTNQNEEAIFLHPDGQTLFFSSQGHKSMGGYDIYKSVLVKGKWSKPVNIGAPINTKEDDVFFVLDASGRTAYYSSEKDGKSKDIYKIYPFSIQEEPKEQPKLTILKGTVKDGVSKNPIEAKIEITDNVLNQVIATFTSNSETGKYLVSLPSGRNYGISVSAPGYLFHSENFDLDSAAAYQEVVKHFLLYKMDVGTKVVLRNIFFDTAKSTLRPESVSELTRLTEVLKNNPTIKIEISGHTDNVGGDDYNTGLSNDRAKSVVDYLVQQGIDTGRLTFKGYGKNQPMASNDTEAGRQENRRVEFKITEK